MKVGYFKVKTTTPIVRPKRELVKLSPQRHPASKPKRHLVPVVGLILALALISGLQLGLVLAKPTAQILAKIDWQPPVENYQAITKVSLPANLVFVKDLSDKFLTWLNEVWVWLQDFWLKLKNKILELADKQLASVNLVDQAVPDSSNNVNNLGLTVVPSSGDANQDEQIKKQVKEMFSDDVEVNFDASGESGVVTPIFRDGRKGGDYVFVLTPVKQ